MSTTPLFSRLLSLNTGRIPLEDFFTELVAYLFSQNKEILYAWLTELKLLDTIPYFDAQVLTQQELKPLEHHFSGSQPDISIELVGESSRIIIFVESKIGSQEGYEQLSRYAEILDTLEGFDQKILIYITRDFEPKSKSDVFKNLPESNVQFKQTRWHQFYQSLKPWTTTALVPEIIAFMNEHNMAHNNQFSSIDILALANFRNSMKLLDEAMSEEVSQRFNEVLGITRHRKKRPIGSGQFYHGRYFITASMPNKWWCGLGFILPISNSTDYPTVCLMIEVEPNSQQRSEIVEAMKEICKQYSWVGYNLDSSRGWAGIFREQSLQDFLSKQDHIAAVKRFFLQTLDELNLIKTQYSQLPWGVVPDQDSEDPALDSSSDIYTDS